MPSRECEGEEKFFPSIVNMFSHNDTHFLAISLQRRREGPGKEVQRLARNGLLHVVPTAGPRTNNRGGSLVSLISNSLSTQLVRRTPSCCMQLPTAIGSDGKKQDNKIQPDNVKYVAVVHETQRQIIDRLASRPGYAILSSYILLQARLQIFIPHEKMFSGIVP